MLNDSKETIKKYYDIYFSIGQIYEELAKMHDITSTSLFVLYVIKEYPNECTQHLICEKLCYPKQTVNAILNSLEKKDFISKRISENDKRIKYIFFTELGKKYTNDILFDMEYLESMSFNGMNPSDRDAMISGELVFLEQLKKTLNSMKK